MKRWIVVLLMVVCVVSVPVYSLATDADVAGTKVAVLVNVNTAGSQELQQLPGIGQSIAERILDYREKGGRFARAEDLKQIKGIGQKTVERIKPMVVVE